MKNKKRILVDGKRLSVARLCKAIGEGKRYSVIKDEYGDWIILDNALEGRGCIWATFEEEEETERICKLLNEDYERKQNKQRILNNE